jgi:hypothetical protein
MGEVKKIEGVGAEDWTRADAMAMFRARLAAFVTAKSNARIVDFSFTEIAPAEARSHASLPFAHHTL